jgi:hypothetical protein
MFADLVGISERAVRSFNLPQTLIGGCAYIDRAEGLKQIGAGMKRRNQPPTRRGQRRR